MANLTMLGTDYGGWIVDLDLIPHGSTVISAGVGEDISFDLELINKFSCNVVGIDPTPKSHKFINNHKELKNFYLIKKALTDKNNDIIKLFKNTNPNHVSESELKLHSSVSQYDYHLAETINLPFLFENYHNISVIKMDIEGSEYSVIKNLHDVPDSVKQICVEFHHFCSDRTIEETVECIKHIQSFGFTKIHEKSKHQKLAEVTLIR